MQMTKNDQLELRHLLWAMVPTVITLIFAAGGLFFTIQNTTAKIKEDEIKYDQQNKDMNTVLMKYAADANDIKISIARIETKLESLVEKGNR